MKITPPAITAASATIGISVTGTKGIKCKDTDECGNVKEEWELNVGASGSTSKDVHAWVTPVPSTLVTAIGIGLHAVGQGLNVYSHVSAQKAEVLALIYANSPTLMCKASR